MDISKREFENFIMDLINVDAEDTDSVIGNAVDLIVGLSMNDSKTREKIVDYVLCKISNDKKITIKG